MWDRIIGVFEPSVRVSGSPLARRIRRISPSEKQEEAKAFLKNFYTASGTDDQIFQTRWDEVRKSLTKTGHYDHTPEELAYGARVAWRNHARCIGRLFWESLEVVDCRDVTEPEGIAARMFTHLDTAYGDGRIRSIISVFEPVKGDSLPCWIESPQIVQYACHRREDGSIMGDRQNSELTRIAQSHGWQPPEEPGQFDHLPVLIRDKNDRRSVFEIPKGLVKEVEIHHNDFPELSSLGLRWYSVPIVSGMIMTIGGIDYPCAPFNGFYMGTEIGSRNFADARRYDLLETVAETLQLKHGESDPLWKDRTLTELNAAVLQSFDKAGVTMLDHHAAADQYMTFYRREQAAGRRVAGDWSWLVPPQASAACEVFHLDMRNFHPVPNYYNDRGTDGLELMPWYGDAKRNRLEVSVDRIRRRLKIWKRIAW